MDLQVINRELCVNTLKIDAVASSSLLLIGDANTIQLASTFDTPAESLIIGPFVPLTPKG
ncbi:spore gernimation protein GerPD [Bacillus salacetis]|uniref:Spore gernimation protein GerPD n=1 Tax=Bacillus salacetis TaxID=2315464 RepID=A0A3A1R194_9BACI|nr:spore gernimation protein GerPD [Bacillus salacetis]RIW35373.1 spore gernimation protein GerPD [Bacillus salacetis]